MTEKQRDLSDTEAIDIIVSNHGVYETFARLLFEAGEWQLLRDLGARHAMYWAKRRIAAAPVKSIKDLLVDL